MPGNFIDEKVAEMDHNLTKAAQGIGELAGIGAMPPKVLRKAVLDLMGRGSVWQELRRQEQAIIAASARVTGPKRRG